MIWSLSLAAMLAFTGIAQAAPSPAERETARRLMDEGKARLKANEVARAVEAFQKAHDIMHVPTTGIALARAHLSAGHLVEARDVALEIGRLPHEPGRSGCLRRCAEACARARRATQAAHPHRAHQGSKGGVPVRASRWMTSRSRSSIVGEPVAVNPGKRVFSARNAEGGEAKEEARGRRARREGD